MLLPVAQAAKAIGVSVRWLQMWCKGEVKDQPALPHERDAKRRYLVDPSVAYEHIRKYCAKPPDKLKAPEGHTPAAAAPGLKLADAGLPTEPQALIAAILARPEVVEGVPSEVLKTIKVLAAESRLAAAAQAKQGEYLDPREVIAMFQGYGKLFVSVLEQRIAEDALDLLRTVQLEFGVDLMQANSAAKLIVEARLRDRANAVIRELDKHLAEKCKALKIRELLAE